ncbi:MAG: radical SAM protein [Nitrososphaerota archaeon]
MEYKYSKWNIECEYKGKIIILNTLTSAAIMVEKSDLEKIKNENFDLINKELLNALKENGIIVNKNKEKDENASFWLLFHTIKYRSFFDVFHLVIMPTYRCNFECKYCFEDIEKLESYKENMINPAMIKEWVEKLWNISKFNTFKVVFYGGEPFLNKILLEDYINTLKTWSEIKGVEFSFSIITNGYLLNKEDISILVEKGLGEIQITLDGVKEIHDQRRPLKGGRGSFTKIYENLISLLSLPLRIVIRTNLDRHNFLNFKDFIKLLKKDGILSRKNVSLSPALVDPSPGKVEWCRKFVPEILSERVQILEKIWTDLIEEIEDTNFLLNTHKVEFGLCNAKIKDSFIIGPDGSLYTCYSLIGYEEGKIGHLKEGFNSKYAEFVYSIDQKIQQCLKKNCVFLPLCTGGCFYQAFVEKGNISEVVCPEEFYKKIWISVKLKIYEKILKY